MPFRRSVEWTWMLIVPHLPRCLPVMLLSYLLHQVNQMNQCGKGARNFESKLQYNYQHIIQSSCKVYFDWTNKVTSPNDQYSNNVVTIKTISKYLIISVRWKLNLEFTGINLLLVGWDLALFCHAFVRNDVFHSDFTMSCGRSRPVHWPEYRNIERFGGAMR